MPRVRYRPWLLYEEAVGTKNARRVMFAAFGMLGFNISVMMWMWLSFAGKSRHVSFSDEENVAYNRYIEDKFGSLVETMQGDGPKFNVSSGYRGMR